MVMIFLTTWGKAILFICLTLGMVFSFFEPFKEIGFYFMGISIGMSILVIFDTHLTVEGFTNGKVFVHEIKKKEGK